MVDFFNIVLEWIRVDLIIGFGWYSILLFILKLFPYKKEFFTQFDKLACKTVVFLGIAYGVIAFTILLAVYLNIAVDEERSRFIQRATGYYWLGYLLQPLFFVAWTQLLRIRFVRKILVFRLLICVLFVLSFEQCVIMYTSFQRDYLPVGWTLYNLELGITWWEFLLSFVIKIIEFIVIMFAYKYAKQSIMKFKTVKVN